MFDKVIFNQIIFDGQTIMPVEVFVSDAGAGADMAAYINIIKKLAVDAGLGIDQIDVNEDIVAIQDSGAASELITASQLASFLQDAGVGAETISVLINTFLQDTGFGEDEIFVPLVYSAKYSKQHNNYNTKYL